MFNNDREGTMGNKRHNGKIACVKFRCEFRYFIANNCWVEN